MKKFAVILLVMLWCSAAFAETYPEIGICTGDRVKLHARPSTKSRIVGQIDGKRNMFVILDSVQAEGRKWYKIDLPTKKGTAYVDAKSVNYGLYYQKPTGEDFVKVRQIFGIYPEKAEAIFGEADLDNAGNRIFDNFLLIYDDEDILWQAHIKNKKFSLCGVHVGDNPRKLLNLGMPKDILDDLESDSDDDEEVVDGPEGWTYRDTATDEEIFFEFGIDDSGYIIEMITWTRPASEG